MGGLFERHAHAPQCPTCGQPTLPHCETSPNCRWWKCNGCKMYGMPEKQLWVKAMIATPPPPTIV